MWFSSGLAFRLLTLLFLAVLCDAAQWRARANVQSGIRRKGVAFLDSPLLPRQQKQQVIRAVSAQCGESTIVVQVKTDLFGTGQLINASDLSLGDCAVTRQDTAAQLLIFEAELQACRSVLSTVDEQLVYSFSLNYTPKPLANTPIVRTNGAVVGIECQYMRLHNVSSNALKPTWVPYTSTKSAEDLLDFSLSLMSDDWRSQRSSNVFYLGDVLNIEASVTQANHQPLRLFVDSCVATLVPDQTSTPSYSFIENKGCLTDAKSTGSSSQFMPRTQDTKLQMKLDAFRFYQDARSSIYITCHLKVTPASQSVDSLNKDCYTEGSRSVRRQGAAVSCWCSGEGAALTLCPCCRWRSVDGSDQVCSCCDSSCVPSVRSRYWGGRSRRDLASTGGKAPLLCRSWHGSPRESGGQAVWSTARLVLLLLQLLSGKLMPLLVPCLCCKSRLLRGQWRQKARAPS
ncbi:zona pellucida sperm-binding protein 3-like [Lepisosteus oculatus]|uniref:zona pellucida sperm-binding protein 3-like n=1 Tax=Lepisosteus oculatus TaxID=7918 RepID=UPI003714D981